MTVRALSTSVALAALLLSSCASTRTPIYMNPVLKKRPPARIDVLPVLDCRPVRKEPIDLEVDLRTPILEELRGMGYDARLGSYPAGCEVEGIPDWDDDELARLLPAGSESVLVVILEELLVEESSTLGIPKFKFSERLHGRLVTRDGVTWMDRGECAFMNGGILGASIAKSSSVGARARGARDLVESFPKRKKE